MNDPYTTEARLCDDAGMVSDERVAPGAPGTALDPELTYRKQLNNLRGHTGLPHYEGAPFQCTGSAHLAREHIRCTNPTHVRRVPIYPTNTATGIGATRIGSLTPQGQPAIRLGGDRTVIVAV